MRTALICIGLLFIAFVPIRNQRQGLQVGSKAFTESVVLGELLTQLSTSTETPAIHRAAIGGSSQLFSALLVGDVDIYPDYTGTIRLELLSGENLQSMEEVSDYLAGQGILVSRPLGFQNGYAIGMLREKADALEIETVSDVARHTSLRFGLTNEFLNRSDGWPGLRTHYGLRHDNVRGMDHDIAYRALKNADIDVMELYTTDAKIEVLDIKVLEDDRKYFKDYDAVLLYRDDLVDRFPVALETINTLQGAIRQKEMMLMNSRVDFDKAPEREVAADWLAKTFGIQQEVHIETAWEQIWKHTVEHIDLVRKSLIPAIFVGIGLGILAYKRRWLGQGILAVTGIVQTIPALALLVLLIQPVAIINFGSISSGVATAYVALFLYSLLPITRSTFTGLAAIDPAYLDSADALGLPRGWRLRKIELPLAMRHILSGVKTAAILNIGFATLGALIGAGGYGDPVLAGIRTFDTPKILMGAIPAAVMALLCQAFFECVERWLVPRGLRMERVH